MYRIEEKRRKMKWRIRNLQTCLYLTAAIILLVGLGSALLIYLTADSASDSALVFDFVHSKKYRHDLEVYGGKASVITDQFCRWFEGLWHGKSLALTVACITISISFGFFFVAYHLPSDLNFDAFQRKNRAK